MEHCGSLYEILSKPMKLYGAGKLQRKLYSKNCLRQTVIHATFDSRSERTHCTHAVTGAATYQFINHARQRSLNFKTNFDRESQRKQVFNLSSSIQPDNFKVAGGSRHAAGELEELARTHKLAKENPQRKREEASENRQRNRQKKLPVEAGHSACEPASDEHARCFSL